LGKYVVNHSYIIPGFVHVITGVAAGYFLSFIFF
jgi:anaerobic C4-dicarboxylate transporter